MYKKIEKEKQNARKRFKKFLLKEQETVIFTLIYLILITFLLKDAFVILYMIPLLWELYNTKNYLMVKEYYKNLQDIEINKSSKTIKDFNKDIVIKNGMTRNFANLNLTIPKNKICMIYGPNLSGKTTILDSLAGNINLDKGDIVVDGKVLSPKRLETSYMQYNDYLFSNTIKNMFLEINPNINETRIHFWLRQVNAEYFTYDLKKVILNNGEDLTREEQSKLKIALNLIKDNNILLFDEPFKYFDTNTIKRITANLRYLSNTIIITTNDYKHLKFADLVCIIDDNSVLYQGLYKDIPNNLERKYNL